MRQGWRQRQARMEVWKEESVKDSEWKSRTEKSKETRTTQNEYFQCVCFNSV